MNKNSCIHFLDDWNYRELITDEYMLKNDETNLFINIFPFEND